MSADNWAICPRCKVRRGDRFRALDVALTESYGQVPVEEFDRLRAERDREVGTEQERTFREDYEFWMDENGRFTATYSGGCRECGLGHKFEHVEHIDVGGAS